VTVQHWDFPDASVPVRLLAAGYDVINSEQAFLYIDGKTSDDGQFPQSLNETLLWAGAPGGRGWAPNVFSPTDVGNNTSVHHPRLRGALFALWNDWGNNATTPLEIYYQLARSIPLFAEKTWTGSGVRASELTQVQFDGAYPALNAAAPGQNLNRVVSVGAGGVVFSYNLTQHGPGAVVHTGVPSIGPPYTLSFDVMDDPKHPGKAVLFAGLDPPGAPSDGPLRARRDPRDKGVHVRARRRETALVGDGDGHLGRVHGAREYVVRCAVGDARRRGLGRASRTGVARARRVETKMNKSIHTQLCRLYVYDGL
jgi:hypothetical protein